ncbi:hypothetical protein HZA33_04685 [Candidatus Pacearchaeota archaeon]|nr:hypothetical protein [Candidatus Pacearchaeota archaeon]
MVELRLMEKRLAENPIALPKNPFMEVFERFGSCEVIAMFAGAAGTAIAGNFVGGLGKEAKDLTLAIAGRVSEKPSFFIPPFVSEINKYRTTPYTKRDNLNVYLNRAAKIGGRNFLEDLAVQDVITTGTMFAALNLYPQTPPWMLSILSTIFATITVTGLEVAVTELRYAGYKHKLKRAGFNSESYLESRFFISAEKHPEEVLNELDKEFDLGDIKEWYHHDRYFTEVKIPYFSGRQPEVRLRTKVRTDGSESKRTAEITFKRAHEVSCKQPEQHRYFPIIKDKLAYVLDYNCENVSEIIEPKVRKILKKALRSETYQDVSFNRAEAHNLETLLVSLDQVHNEKEIPFYLVELKTHSHAAGLLEDAMRYMMRNFPVLETTYEKLELVDMNGKD